jgi:hypothetical protein
MVLRDRILRVHSKTTYPCTDKRQRGAAGRKGRAERLLISRHFLEIGLNDVPAAVHVDHLAGDIVVFD